jgi:hypothetical protein
LAQSKDKAEAIVKEMLIAMGGANNYNNTHFIQWDFVNRKPHGINGREFAENPTANQVILVNINTLKGKVYENGVLLDETKANGLLEKEELVDK